MAYPTYLDLMQARALLKKMNVALNERQIKRAAEMDAKGKRKLPFFVDPIDGRLKIEKNSLVNAYRKLQIEAEKACKNR